MKSNLSLRGHRAGRSLTLLLLAITGLPHTAAAHDIPTEMAEAANRFLNSLDAKQRQEVSIDFDTEKRKGWHFIPSTMMDAQGGRRGLTMKRMSGDQRALAHGLVSTALSHKGYLQSMTIMALETILRDLEKGNPARDSELYHVAVYGTPSTKTTWGWSFEGHHLSVNLTLVDGHRFSVTPSFFGSNPAVVPKGNSEGLETLAPEQKLARRLAQSLDSDQRKLAIIAKKAPSDIVTGAQPNVAKRQFLPAKGIPFEKLNKDQQQLLQQLASQFIDKYRRPILDQIDERTPVAPGPGTFFAWAGSLNAGEGHYYRIQTPTFLFEYDNTQNGANHIHAVWRQFDGDFGADLLKHHLETSPHHK